MREEIKNEVGQYTSDKRYRTKDITYCLKVMCVVEVWLNHQIYEPKMKTGVVTTYEIG